MPIRAVCFDLGKVLIDFDWQIMLGRIAPETRLTPGEITAQMTLAGLFLEYEIGAIGSNEFFAQLKARLDYRGEAAALRACFSEIFTPLESNIALAQSLSAHYPLALISNTNEAHIVHAEAAYPFFPLFPIRIYSHQVGAMKPKPEIYQAAWERLGRHLAAGEILFIDDLAPNIAGAEALGWRTIHLTPEVMLADELQRFDLLGLKP